MKPKQGAIALALAIATTAAFAPAAPATSLYLSTGTSLRGFSVAPTGAPTAIPGGAIAATAASQGLGFDPTGNFAFMSTATGNKLNAWSLDVADAPSLVSGSPFNTISTPETAVIPPGGQTIYVDSAFNDAGVNAYKLNPDGSVSFIENAFVNGNANGMVATPNGKYLYVCGSLGQLFGFSIDADGGLTALVGVSPRPNTGCEGIGTSVDGKTLFISDTSEIIKSLGLNDNGTLSAATLDTDTTGYRPYELVTSANGKFMFTLNVGSGVTEAPSVSAYTTESDGAFAKVGADALLGAVNTHSSGLAISPDSRFLYAGFAGAGNNVHVFAIGAGAELTEIAGSPFAAGGTLAFGARQTMAFRPAQGPTAAITDSLTGSTRTLSAAASTDSDSAIASYQWDFGDGSSQTTTDATVSHKYASGVFNATVSATDADGCGTSLLYNGVTTLCNPGKAASIVIDAQPPIINGLTLTYKKFKVNKKAKAPTVAKKKMHPGTGFKYSLTEAGPLSIQIEKPAKGRKAGGSCAKPTSKNKKGKRCTRYVSAGKAIKLRASAGSHLTAFSGKVGSKALKPGKYRAVLTLTDASGNVSSAKRASFAIVK
jgi:6-phosphogluconolactonase (cycloisomerase 2 family)